MISIDDSMKKWFFSLFSFGRNPELVNISVSVSKKLANDLEAFSVRSGLSNHRLLFASMIALTRWLLDRLDQGYVIIAISPHDLNYQQLDVSKTFPNLSATSSAEVDLDNINTAIDHYNWCVEQQGSGAKVGVMMNGRFIEAPVFKPDDLV